MIRFTSILAFAVMIQACGTKPSATTLDSQGDEDVVIAENELTEIDATIALAPIEGLSLVHASHLDSSVDQEAAGVSETKEANSVSAATVQGVFDVKSALPDSFRVTFTLQASSSEKPSAVTEKRVFEQAFPKDISSQAVESKSKMKLRNRRTYQVTVEQLKDQKVLQTTVMDFKFHKRKKSALLKLSTSQRAGVMVRFEQGRKEKNVLVLRECPAGQLMSGTGFHDIPICRQIPAVAQQETNPDVSPGPNPPPPAPAPCGDTAAQVNCVPPQSSALGSDSAGSSSGAGNSGSTRRSSSRPKKI